MTDLCNEWFLYGDQPSITGSSKCESIAMEKVVEKCNSRPFTYRRTFYLVQPTKTLGNYEIDEMFRFLEDDSDSELDQRNSKFSPVF